MELLKAIIEGKRAELEQLESILAEESGKESKAAAKPEKKTEKAEKPAAKSDAGEYSGMKSTELYKECCRRGISSKCTSRTKEFLINVLLEDDRAKSGSTEKPEKTAKAKSEKPTEDDWGEDDWGEDDKEKSPYEGKTARELYDLCRERGIKAEKRQDAVAYAKLLEANDKAADDPADDDDGEDWNID